MYATIASGRPSSEGERFGIDRRHSLVSELSGSTGAINVACHAAQTCITMCERTCSSFGFVGINSSMLGSGFPN